MTHFHYPFIEETLTTAGPQPSARHFNPVLLLLYGLLIQIIKRSFEHNNGTSENFSNR
jgi:hypothetical protein